MNYTYFIEQTQVNGNTAETKVIKRLSGLTLSNALDYLRYFTLLHPTGKLTNRNEGTIKYETSDTTLGASLSACIAYSESNGERTSA